MENLILYFIFIFIGVVLLNMIIHRKNRSQNRERHQIPLSTNRDLTNPHSANRSTLTNSEEKKISSKETVMQEKNKIDKKNFNQNRAPHRNLSSAQKTSSSKFPFLSTEEGLSIQERKISTGKNNKKIKENTVYRSHENEFIPKSNIKINSKEEAKKAFIYSEILNRKY